MTDEQYQALENELRPRLTDEFLATLVEAAKIDGNGGDWPAIKDFVQNTFSIAGKPMPEMKPYQ